MHPVLGPVCQCEIGLNAHFSKQIFALKLWVQAEHYEYDEYDEAYKQNGKDITLNKKGNFGGKTTLHELNF